MKSDHQVQWVFKRQRHLMKAEVIKEGGVDRENGRHP